MHIRHVVAALVTLWCAVFTAPPAAAHGGPPHPQEKTEDPFVFLHYHVLPDGQVEVTGTYRMRLYEIAPDGHLEEHLGVAICLDSKTGGKSEPSGSCREWGWVARIAGGGVGGTAGAGVGLLVLGSAAAATPAGILAFAFLTSVGGAGGVEAAAAWVEGGCQMPPQWMQSHEYQYNWPGDFSYKNFDYNFPGLHWESVPLIDPWWEGVGDGHGTGGDVLRIPSGNDGRVGSSNPTDVWIGWTFGSPPFSGARPLEPWQPGDPGLPVQPPPPPVAPSVDPGSPATPEDTPGAPPEGDDGGGAGEGGGA